MNQQAPNSVRDPISKTEVRGWHLSVSKADNMCLFPRTYTIEGENQLHRVSSNLHTGVEVHTLIHTHHK